MKHIRRRDVLRLTALGLGATALAPLARIVTAAAAARDSSEAQPSEVAWRWFEQLYDVVRIERITPPEASRLYGLAAVALYEAVAGGAPSYVSMAGQLRDLRSLPMAGEDAYWPAVANAALASTIVGLRPELSSPSKNAVARLEQTLRDRFATAASSGVVAGSAAAGKTLAASLLDWASADGMAANRALQYRPRGDVEGWRPTPPAFNPRPLEPGWGANRPLVLGSGQEAAPSGRPKFSLETGSAFYESAREVYETARALTPAQKVIADYWADNAGATGTPPGHWMAIVSQIVRNEGLPLAAAAEAFLRAGIAVHDAFICCWSAKYEQDLMRPVSYINANIDATWKAYIDTPNFPSYTSGHSTQSAAAATVLTDMFGLKRFRDTTHSDHGLTPALEPRLFGSFDEAAQEAAVSRLYGGIHYVFDNNDGFLAGQRLGQAIISRVRFRRPPV